MVKFFLRNDKNQPKSSQPNKHSSGHKNSKTQQKKKPKKVLDYRIVIWKKLFNLIKAEHSILVQKMIRKIKQTKQKIQQLNQLKDSQEKIKRVSSLEKQLEKLDKKYQLIKEQKKHELKLITLYIIVEIFKIQNLQKVLEKAKIPTESFKINQLKSIVQNSQGKKFFVQKVSRLTVYQQELQKCAQLIDVVQQKKLQRKTKLKQRKVRKYQRQHGITNSNQQPSEGQNKDLQLIQEENSDQQNQEQNKKSININKQKKIERKPQQHIKKQQKTNKNFNPSKNQYQKNPKHQQKQPKFQKRQFNNKTKHIQKQRTEFKKTGRNKVKFEKQQRKKQYQKGQDNKQPNNKGQKKQFKKGNPKYGFTKQMAHPSWQAKQQLKQQVFIKPFEGKKILL